MSGSGRGPGPTIIDTVAQARERLGEFFEAARRIVVFTGAGASTECGVPDYRSPGSPWRQHAPIAFQAFLADPVMRVEAWRRKFAMDDIYAGARPGRVHRATARLAEAGRVIAVITQNIDGLHGAAGLDPGRLIELHGNGTYARCLSCGTRHELAAVRADLERTGEAPACRCGGMIKSATVAFGQAVPPEALRAAAAAALGCDLFLVLGSSLVVQPAARLPVMARRNGAVLVLANREPTRLDHEADAVFRCDVGVLMEPWSEPA